jgi:hypothetical protein
MAQQEFQVDRTTALYERPAMNIVDAPTYSAVKAAIEAKFAAGKCGGLSRVAEERRIAHPQL